MRHCCVAGKCGREVCRISRSRQLPFVYSRKLKLPRFRVYGRNFVFVGAQAPGSISMIRRCQHASEALGARAIRKLESWGLSFDPANYEIAYLYVEESNLALNREIDAITEGGRTLTRADIARLRVGHLLQEQLSQRVNLVGRNFQQEVEQVIGMIEASIGLHGDFGDTLRDSRQQLTNPLDREALRGIITAVLSQAQDVEKENVSLSSNLRRSRDDISRLQDDLVTIRAESLSDPLTGAANRKHLDQFLNEAIRCARQTQQPLSFLLADVDHFKSFNDRFGHLTGDRILRLIADTLRQNLKRTDLVARFGGEEFAVVLPDTRLVDSRRLAENLRRAIATHDLIKPATGESLGRVTVSVGVSTWHAGEEIQALIDAADVCLYEAKKSGRNRVVAENELDGVESVERKFG